MAVVDRGCAKCHLSSGNSEMFISEVLHSEIRQKDSARGSEVENAREDSACLFGKSSLCRKYFSDEFSVEER